MIHHHCCDMEMKHRNGNWLDIRVDGVYRAGIRPAPHGMVDMELNRYLRVYVHVPFCVHKCHYCDFNSHVRRAPDWDGWLQAVLLDWQRHAPHQRSIGSVFIGGGTPSLMPPAVLAQLLQALEQTAGFDADIEITMEANPGTVEAARFRAYRSSGVNRLSIGVQSLDASELQWLERIHDQQQAEQAFLMARAAGFDNINLDLMYALPDQHLVTWLHTLSVICRWQPEHLSCYQLTVEPGTRLAAMHANNPDMNWPDEQLASDFFSITRERLADAGFAAYEVSNYAQSGKYCRHNDGYWQYDDYIGLGPGAAGKRDLANGGVYRWCNTRSPEAYVRQMRDEHVAIGEDETLSIEEAAREAFWLALRRQNGVEHAHFQQRFSLPLLQRQQRACQHWLESGQLNIHAERTAINEQGWLLADSIAASVFVT